MNKAVSYKTLIAYCTYIRKAFPAKGILIYSERASQKLKIIGRPFQWQLAGNDNEAKR